MTSRVSRRVEKIEDLFNNHVADYECLLAPEYFNKLNKSLVDEHFLIITDNMGNSYYVKDVKTRCANGKIEGHQIIFKMNFPESEFRTNPQKLLDELTSLAYELGAGMFKYEGVLNDRSIKKIIEDTKRPINEKPADTKYISIASKVNTKVIPEKPSEIEYTCIDISKVN